MKKKTLKAIFAAALAVIMLIPGISVFAANDTLVWDFYGDEYIYDYAGEITLGTTEVPEDASDFIWYSFDVQEEGFYYIHFNQENMNAWFGIPESFEGNTAYNEAEFIRQSDENADGSIYYLEAGKTLVGFDLFYLGENAAFETEYLGNEITEVKPQYDLIYGYDIYGYEYMGINEVEMEAGFDLTFSGGKTIELYYLCGTSDSALVSGENTVKVKIYDKEYETAVNVYYVEDYVESVELSNIEKYLYVYEYYNEIDYEYPRFETIKVTFKDGSTYTVQINEDGVITLPNGRSVSFFLNYSETDIGNYYFDIYVGGTCLVSLECEVKTVSVDENIDKLSQATQHHISDAAYYLRRAFEVAFEDGFIGFFDYGATESLIRIEWAISSFISVFDEITSLMMYLLS